MIRFVQPLALLALLALLPLWAIACATWRATSDQRAWTEAYRRAGTFGRWLGVLRRAPWRFWTSLLLPTAAIIALVLALAGMQVVTPVSTLNIVFVLDRSDSVSADGRARAELYLQQALGALPPDDHAGLVVFGQRALVERPLVSDRTFGSIAALPGGARTNIGAALELALAMLPPEGQRRLVLLSDGGANAGDAQLATRLAAVRSVPLDVVPLHNPVIGLDVQVAAATLPHEAREGQRLQMQIATTSPITTAAHLRVIDNGNTVIDQSATLPQGPGQLTIDLPAPPTGFNRYEVRVEVAGDVRPQNNVIATYSVVHGPAHVLLVARAREDARNLADALIAGGVVSEQIAPADIPTALSALNRFDAVVLVDVPLNDLPRSAETILPTYVRDLGRGLLMVGGPRSFGLGGYNDSPIEAALPVTMRPQPNQPAPPVAVVVVIDTSGSMSERAGKVTKEQLAATGAARIATQLRDNDQITVIPFDREAKHTIGPLPGRERDAIIAQLGRIGPGAGGIDFFDSVMEAARYLRRSNAPVRHLITITDGDDTVQQEGGQALVRQLYAEGVTTTAIAVGDGRDVAFLQDVARQGGGRFFLARTPDSIPDFMSEEARLLLRSYLIQQPFTPTFDSQAPSAPILTGISALPPLSGYIATTAKERAQVLLRASNDDPLLAVWHYGLGHSAAWTSDFTGRWGHDLVQSPAFPHLATQLISWLLPPPSSQRLALTASPQGDQLLLSAAAHDDAGRPVDGLQVTGQLLATDGSTQPVALQEIVPGTYRTTAPDLPPGTYEIQLVAADANGNALATASSGAVLADFSEYRGAPTNETLLRGLAQQTGGRIDPPPTAIYDPTIIAPGAAHDLTRTLLWLALALLPLDLALRRLRFGGRWAQEAPVLEGRGALALVDRLWRTAFGHEPFGALRQRRAHRLQERERWAAWLREQAQRRARGEE